MHTDPIPEGYTAVTPYLITPDVDGLVKFLQHVFYAEESLDRMQRSDGSVMHTEVRIGGAALMMAEPMEGHPPMPSMVYVYVADVDAAYQRALASEAKPVMAPADQFYGDRNAGVTDPWGNMWWIGTHIEDVSPEDLKTRAAAAANGGGE